MQVSIYEIVNWCIHLKEDIESGKIQNIIQAHETDLGDYMFVCEKL